MSILGCGASAGVPAIGCGCAVCTSPDPHNQRTRTSALIEVGATTILIDPGPDFRQQALRANLQTLDAIVVTHPHNDHIAGLDDVRPLNMRMGRAIPLYGKHDTLDRLRRQFDYVFSSESSLSSRPQIELHAIETEPFRVADVTITPLPVLHGDWPILGFRIGAFAYLTDVIAIPQATYALLRDLDVLILGALRRTPHPLHYSLDQAQATIAQIAPRRAFLVHMGHDLEYTATNALLPPHIQLAYDGLTLEIEESSVM